MSGGNIAYHLRPNKAADRALFLDLLNRIGRTSFNISDYKYYGFGGPFMEDFRAIHAATRISHMTCIERDPTVQARQRFNCPLSCVNFQLTDSSTFISEFSSDSPSVVWLDFTSPGELKQQLDDTFNLVNKLAHGDIFRVTLNASVSALREDIGNLKQDELIALRRRVFVERSGIDCPTTLKDSDFRANQYPTILLQALKLAAIRATNHSPLVVQPLSAFTYSDGTTMLTATGIVLDSSKLKIEEFPTDSRIAHWPFASIDWKRPHEIDLPTLSSRERLALESLQPNGTVDAARNILKDAIGPDGITEKAVRSYGTFYRIYPEFVRINA